MGGLILGHAQDRFFETLEERVKETDDLEEVFSLYEQCVDRLTMMCADEVALNNLSREIAVEDSSVEFPTGAPANWEER